MDKHEILVLLYLAAAVLFILGLKRLSHPRTAVSGNLVSSAGMLLGIIAVLAFSGTLSWSWIIAGLLIGTVGGVALAVTIQMTAMPQLVALFNGFGGLASVLVAGGALLTTHEPSLQFGLATAASGLIGAVTFTGSSIAFAKLQELMSGRPILLPSRHIINAGTAVLTLIMGYMMIHGGSPGAYYIILVVLALALGVLTVIPIGGADMPVVISLLNSYSGLAAAATGFVLNDTLLIIAGSLVGASGLILTQIMCKAMNRSLTNVLFGVMGEGGGATASADEVYAGKIKSTSADEVAMMLDGAGRVVIVPGYGLAVGQAQHATQQLARKLEERGTVVEYAIHPVAGRMPGHMNVLLAEAEVPYDKLIEMDTINPTFPQTDMAIIIGANDVVNPDARENPDSPIAGMPILNVDLARTVVVIKRSLSPGFAGIPNPLFAKENCLMLFADAKQAVQDMTKAVEEL